MQHVCPGYLEHVPRSFSCSEKSFFFWGGGETEKCLFFIYIHLKHQQTHFVFTIL